MATKTYTKNFNISKIEELIQDLEETRNHYCDEEEMAVSAGLIFTWFGLLGAPGVVCVPAGLLTTALSVYFDSVQDTITTAITELNKHKDTLQNNPNYDLVRIKLTVTEEIADNTTYLIPEGFETIGIHSKSPSGWLTA